MGWALPPYDPGRRAALRRIAVGIAGGLGVGRIARAGRAAALAPSRPETLTREIPSTGEALPVLGLGTWQTFDVDAAAEKRPLGEVLVRFSELGGRLVDSSPMYGRSEAVVGELAEQGRLRDRLFLATKVWTRGRRAGIEQMERSMQLLRASRLDLLQVHNLLDVDTHLATLRSWKDEGRVRYLGVTHYTESAYAEVARVLRRERLDFLQINYSPFEPGAERELLPLAAERGVAVIANRPFGGGESLRRLLGKPLPPVAVESGAASWAQLVLKWILGNPAVICAIPATSKLRHLEDNLAAGRGPLPDPALRRRIADAIAVA